MTPSSMVARMLETTSETLPERWQSTWLAMKSREIRHEAGQTLQEWLEEVYFDEGREADFTREEIVQVSELIRKLLRLEPAARTAATEVLQDPWFK
jgi:hypothetical protein